MLRIVAVSIAIVAVISTAQAKKFKVTVHTGVRANAGTDARVDITLFGKTSQCGPLKIDDPKDNFEANAVDVFTLDCPTIKGALEKITIQHDNSGSAPGWFLDNIHIDDLDSAMMYDFVCNRWLAKDADDHAISRTLTAHKYKVTVQTGDKDYAGTDAKVFITIYGANGKCGPLRIDNDEDNFERKKVDRFTLLCPQLGNLSKIFIRHDDSGSQPGWYLDKVTVSDKATDKSYKFPCDNWLATSSGDKKIARELKVA